ncbi:MAG TPA: hypothetical protein VGC65_00650 [Bacteroidia bacterium]|jgi:type IV secretory pathway VirB10-like protein
MGNNTSGSNQLDDTVKETLNSYDANYDSGDWSRMERMLDAAPKSSTFNVPYGKVAIVGVAILLGSFLVYKAILPSGNDTVEKIIPAEDETKTEKVITTPPPAITTNTTVVTTPAPITAPEIKPTAPVPTNTPPIVTAESLAKEKALAERAKKEQKKKTDTSNAETKNQKVSVMGNEPIFGDMIDSSKGIIHETKEKESTKKAAKSKGTSGVGLNGLFFNLDSIRKQKEQMKNDSLK